MQRTLPARLVDQHNAGNTNRPRRLPGHNHPASPTTPPSTPERKPCPTGGKARKT